MSSESSGNSGGPGSVLFAAVAGVGSYALGKKHGRNEGRQEGYNQAKAEDTALLRQQQVEIARLQNENRQLLGEKGRLQTEAEVLKALVKEQPTTPQAEAILKALQRVEFRLIEFFPPLFDTGGNSNGRPSDS